MPAGLRTWNAAGVPEITISTRMTRLLGVVNATSSGSVVVPELASGTPFMFGVPRSSGVNIFSGGGGGTISGTTVSWQAGANFIFGVY